MGKVLIETFSPGDIAANNGIAHDVGSLLETKKFCTDDQNKYVVFTSLTSPDNTRPAEHLFLLRGPYLDFEGEGNLAVEIEFINTIMRPEAPEGWNRHGFSIDLTADRGATLLDKIDMKSSFQQSSSDPVLFDCSKWHFTLRLGRNKLVNPRGIEVRIYDRNSDVDIGIYSVKLTFVHTN